MKTVTLLLLLLWSFTIYAGGDTLTGKSGPVSAFLFDVAGTNSVQGGSKAKIIGGKAVTGHDGKSQSAYAFSIHPQSYNSSDKHIIFPIDISPSKFPQLTITAWVKAANCYRQMFIFGNGIDKYSRGIIIDKHDDLYRWGANCGKDGILYGPPLVDEWVFIALMYDNNNQAARLIVNDQVYASRATSHNMDSKAFVGAMNGVIDDIRIFDRVLSQSEIEAISGKPITGNLDELAIKDRYGYKERLKKAEENKVQVGDVFIVDGDELPICDSIRSANTITVLKAGDSLKVIDKLKDGWFIVAFKNGQKGAVSRSNILKNAYPKGGNSFLHKLSYQISHIFDFTKARSWIIVGILAILLFFVKRYFSRLDAFLLRLKKGGDEYADGGSKYGSSPSRRNFLHKIYPITSYPWYPMLTGFLLGATIFIGSFWDSYEMEWFYNEGINILPIGFDRPVHWFLYIMTMLTLLITLSWIVESYVIGGPLVGTLRVFLLLIISFMTWLVTFFLMVLVAIIIIAMIALTLLSGAVGSGKYKCPSCGRSFSASSGSSVSCPGCGAHLST